MNSSPTFFLRLLGSPSLAEEDGRLPGGRAIQRHRLALLALLALSTGRSLSRDKLRAYLWPERDTEHARMLLNQSVHTLRKALGDTVIVSAGAALRLGPGVLKVDAIGFQEALAAGDALRAVGLYGGPILDGFFLQDAPEFEHWVDRERTRFADAYARALDALCDAAEAEPNFPRLIEWLKARATHDPYDTCVALRLVQALDAGGNRGGALRHAAIHERLLREELGVSAPAELRALIERLRR